MIGLQWAALIWQLHALCSTESGLHLNNLTKMSKWVKIIGRDFNFESLLEAIQKHLINLKLMGGQKKTFSILKN